MAFYSLRDPGPGDTGVPVDKVIDVSIIDDVFGVDETSVAVSVNGVPAVSGGVFQPGFSITKIDIPGFFPGEFIGYQYLITPDSTLPPNTTIPMFLFGENKNVPFDTLNQSWTFETAAPPPVLSEDVYIMGMTLTTNAALFKLEPTSPTWTVSLVHENPYSDGSAPRFGNYFMSADGWIFLTTGYGIGGNGNAFSYRKPDGTWYDFQVVDFPPNLISNPAWNGGGCCIYGIDENNIWVGGGKPGPGPNGEGPPALWKWNGSSWTEIWSETYIPFGNLEYVVGWIIPAVEGGGTDEFYFCEADRGNLMHHQGGVVTVLSDSSVHPNAPNDNALACYRIPGDSRIYVATTTRIHRYDPGTNSWEETGFGTGGIAGWPAVDDSGEVYHTPYVSPSPSIFKTVWGTPPTLVFDPVATNVEPVLAIAANEQIVATTTGAILIYSNPDRDNWAETNYGIEFVAAGGNDANGVFLTPSIVPPTDPPEVTPTEPTDGQVDVPYDTLIKFSMEVNDPLEDPWKVKVNRGQGWELAFTYTGGSAVFEPGFDGPESEVVTTPSGFDVVIEVVTPFLYWTVVRIGIAVRDSTGQPAVVV